MVFCLYDKGKKNNRLYEIMCFVFARSRKKIADTQSVILSDSEGSKNRTPTKQILRYTFGSAQNDESFALYTSAR